MREDLSDEDVNRLDNVRKQIWAAGYSGFFIGGATGLGNCIVYKASVVTYGGVKNFFRSSKPRWLFSFGPLQRV